MPFITSSTVLYAWVVTCILFLINFIFHNLSLHSSYKIHQPFTDYFLRLPYSELLEKRVFRSRANRRLIFIFISLYFSYFLALLLFPSFLFFFLYGGSANETA